MKRIVFGSVVLMGLAGCSTYIGEQRPAWRAEAENACLAAGLVRESAVIRASTAMNGPGICGLEHPFKVTALLDGAVTINSTQTLDCPMIAALDGWLKDVVEPAAMARFGERVVRVNSMGSYSCRGINNMAGAHLSEHAFGNAIDIGGFVLESGRELNIMRGFNGPDEQERAFLHEAHAGACGLFTTVLGPGYNIFHYNHFHLDLAMHGGTSRGPRRYCKPVPQQNLPEPPRKDDLPDPPAIEEEMDMARAPLPERPDGISRPAIIATAPSEPPTRQAYTPVPRPVPNASRERGAVPVISFASPEPPAPRPVARRVAEPPPDDGSGMGAGASDGDGADPVAHDGGERPQPPAPIKGAPSDWDLTSSIHRR